MWPPKLTRRHFLKLVSTLGLAGLTHIAFPFSSQAAEYYRIVILGDPHLPVKTEKTASAAERQKIIAAKQGIIEDINSWDDVGRIVVVGDIAADFGNEYEYEYAARYFRKFRKPVSFITGNHDYFYKDAFNLAGHYERGDEISRKEKLSRFKETFRTELFYTRKIGNYLLAFLSVDSLESALLAQMSESQLAWLRDELKNNRTMPAIIFYHAPLPGTLSNYNKHINTSSYIVQPEQAIREIIEDNPQIVLWVSGHTHTPASNPDFAAPINVFAGRVHDIHNSDLNRETIWTNSLYLYPDRIVIKTFDHKNKLWLVKLERTIPVEA